MRGLIGRLGGAICVFLSCCGAPAARPASGGTEVSAGNCGRGLVVVESDYQSSNVSLIDFDGAVLAPSIASSTTKNGGFGVALSGDVVPPGSASTGAQLVLLDRYPEGVLRFIDVTTGALRAELSVATGFRSNPHDYLELGPNQAYVSRYEQNPNPGAQAWDAGADLLVVDPSVPAITGSVDLTPALAGEAARFSPHPGRLLAVGKRVFALLSAYDRDYVSSASSRLVEIDTARDELLSTLKLTDMHGCEGLALAPDSLELAITCTGGDLVHTPPALAGSGLVLVDISGAMRLSGSFPAATFGTQALGFSVDYAAPGHVLFGTLGYFSDSGSAPVPDRVQDLATETGTVVEVVRSQNQPFTLGDVRCARACGACYVADAERSGGSVLRFPLDEEGALGPFRAQRPETAIGLPPRYLSAF